MNPTLNYALVIRTTLFAMKVHLATLRTKREHIITLDVTHEHYHEHPLRDEYGYSKTINFRAERCSTVSVPKRRLLDVEWAVNMPTEKYIGDILFFVENKNCLLEFDFYTEDKETVSKHMGHICELCEQVKFLLEAYCMATIKASLMKIYQDFVPHFSSNKINHCHVCIVDMPKQISLHFLPIREQKKIHQLMFKWNGESYRDQICFRFAESRFSDYCYSGVLMLQKSIILNATNTTIQESAIPITYNLCAPPTDIDIKVEEQNMNDKICMG
uniref:Uncharacterized protein n=1 Tax=Romanomermis culicivorax TaxID=13658 RepID=A0A915J694_ROMCU